MSFWRYRRLPVAWLQLSKERTRLALAVVGVAFATLLMFMQLGFHDALFDNAALVQKRMRCDLVIVSRQSVALFRLQYFSRRFLYRVVSHPDVESVAPLYVEGAKWKNPVTGIPRNILILGLDPRNPIFSTEGFDSQIDKLREADACLFDRLSRPEFGPVPELFEEKGVVPVEVNRRKFKVRGIVQLGASFAADGNILMSDANFKRLMPGRSLSGVDVGMIKLRAGVDKETAKADIARMLPNDLRVMTMPEFVEFEKDYWRASTPIGFVFTVGSAMGFVVGFVVVYQILYTDVSNHLPQYATLKAIGYTDRYLLGVVFMEAFLLAVLGFVPGLLVSLWLYRLTHQATALPMEVSPFRLTEVFVLTVVMCLLSGAMAVRKLRNADPADVF